MDYELRITDDGSTTLYSKAVKDTYHSSFGAIQESQFIFIDQGLLKLSLKQNVKILEIGFGTGLNAILTLKASNEYKISVKYTGIEPFPLDSLTLNSLNYFDQIKDNKLKNSFSKIHSSKSNVKNIINDLFRFEVLHESLQDVRLGNDLYDIVYFDAFGPDAQPEMWTKEMFEKVYSSMKQGASLLTFSAKGIVKRNLRSAGFRVERLEGPPGKRHILRAKKE